MAWVKAIGRFLLTFFSLLLRVGRCPSILSLVIMIGLDTSQVAA